MTGTGERSDAALAADVKAITDRVHEMLWADWDALGKMGSPTVTIHLKMSAAWLPLMAWMQLVERGRRQGRAGPPSVPVHDLNERHLRRLARRWLQAHIEDEMHWQLHGLCIGDHPLLLPLPVETQRPADDVSSEYDLPF